MAQVVFVRCFLQKMEVYILFGLWNEYTSRITNVKAFEEKCNGHSDAYPSYK